MQVGLKRGTVAVEPHRLEWETAAQEIIVKLKRILKDDMIDAQHIGSTAIKNICAKPIVDIVVGDLENNIRTHYIHAVIWGQEAWNDYINMRDYLNTHEKEAKEYSELKERLAKKYPEDRIDYTNGKSE